mmetsp:Transcript_12518/g.38245  ORF Transcript_12518/g.38245 Transcript_12518/m.38245 type:complete len:82 (+) Transcript_12518:1006-1251(+)
MICLPDLPPVTIALSPGRSAEDRGNILIQPLLMAALPLPSAIRASSQSLSLVLSPPPTRRATPVCDPKKKEESRGRERASE